MFSILNNNEITQIVIAHFIIPPSGNLPLFKNINIFISGPSYEKGSFGTYVDSDGPYQTAHLRSLIRAFTLC